VTAGLVRRAGRGRDGAGRLVLWSIAEGRRGRRWREATLDAAGIGVARSLTLETGPDRRPTRLELATGLGLLTLHFEPHGLFGNVVTSSGVRPLHVAGAPRGSRLVVVGSGLAAAAACWSLEPELGVGDRLEIEAVGVAALDPGGAASFSVELLALAVERIDAEAWHLVSPGEAPTAIWIDSNGLPRTATGDGWPLEAEEA